MNRFSETAAVLASRDPTLLPLYGERMARPLALATPEEREALCQSIHRMAKLLLAMGEESTPLQKRAQDLVKQKKLLELAPPDELPISRADIRLLRYAAARTAAEQDLAGIERSADFRRFVRDQERFRTITQQTQMTLSALLDSARELIQSIPDAARTTFENTLRSGGRTALTGLDLRLATSQVLTHFHQKYVTDGEARLRVYEKAQFAFEKAARDFLALTALPNLATEQQLAGFAQLTRMLGDLRVTPDTRRSFRDSGAERALVVSQLNFLERNTPAVQNVIDSLAELVVISNIAISIKRDFKSQQIVSEQRRQLIDGLVDDLALWDKVSGRAFLAERQSFTGRLLTFSRCLVCEAEAAPLEVRAGLEEYAAQTARFLYKRIREKGDLAARDSALSALAEHNLIEPADIPRICRALDACLDGLKAQTERSPAKTLANPKQTKSRSASPQARAATEHVEEGKELASLMRIKALLDYLQKELRLPAEQARELTRSILPAMDQSGEKVDSLGARVNHYRAILRTGGLPDTFELLVQNNPALLSDNFASASAHCIAIVRLFHELSRRQLIASVGTPYDAPQKFASAAALQELRNSIESEPNGSNSEFEALIGSLAQDFKDPEAVLSVLLDGFRYGNTFIRGAVKTEPHRIVENAARKAGQHFPSLTHDRVEAALTDLRRHSNAIDESGGLSLVVNPAEIQPASVRSTVSYVYSCWEHETGA